MGMKTATIAAALMLAGCERVTEYKCSSEQIEAVIEQLDLCDRISDGNMLKNRECYKAAQRAHCEVVREYHRTEIKAEE
jgi:hypothetical protein